MWGNGHARKARSRQYLFNGDLRRVVDLRPRWRQRYRTAPTPLSSPALLTWERLATPNKPSEVKARKLHVIRDQSNRLFLEELWKCLGVQDPNFA